MYNLWFNDDGDMELDFDSDIEVYFNPLLFIFFLVIFGAGYVYSLQYMQDIRISGDVKLFGEHSKPIFQQHIANVYNYSLRVSTKSAF